MSSSLTGLSFTKAGPPSELPNHCIPCTMYGAWNMASTQNPYDSAAAAAAKSLQSCLTLCDPIDGSPPGSPRPWILQARTLE